MMGAADAMTWPIIALVIMGKVCVLVIFWVMDADRRRLKVEIVRLQNENKALKASVKQKGGG